MTRAGNDPTRLKKGKGRTASSHRWLTRQINDPYVQRPAPKGGAAAQRTN